YGSYYAQCAPNIWHAITHPKPLVIEATGQTLLDHLKAKGILELGECDPDSSPRRGTFEFHLRAIEEDFWGRRFKVVAEWKQDWWEAYRRNGGYRMVTGFAVNVPLDRKQVCNGAIQGPAFHLNLWSIIRIVRNLRKYKFKSRMIGEIHDCSNYNLKPKERDSVFDMVSDVMTSQVKEWATWMTVPLVVEAELCPIGASWFDKMALKKADGKYVPGDQTKWEKKYSSWSLQG